MERGIGAENTAGRGAELDCAEGDMVGWAMIWAPGRFEMEYLRLVYQSRIGEFNPFSRLGYCVEQNTGVFIRERVGSLLY